MKKKSVQPQVSVLVPIYNVARYLPQCLDSLIAQTLKDIEIICINDGSTDDSFKIIKEYAKKDNRIVIINKKNSGYGDSMNHGLAKAKGEYIGILESDDWIEPVAYKKMYQAAKKFDAEVVKASYFQHLDGRDKCHKIARKDQTKRLSDPAVEPFIFLEPPAIWAAIYKNDFLKRHKIDFLKTPGASYQDTSFNFKVWSMAHRVVFLDECFVHYRLDNENSSVNQKNKINYVSKEYNEIEKYLKEKNLMFNLGGLMEWVKFRTYFWNLQRLSPELTVEFIPIFQKEFKKATKEGWLQKTYFHGQDRLAYDLIMHSHPTTINKLIQLRKRLRGRL